MIKTALILGITGQDGTLLSRLLQDQGLRVFGISRSVETHSVFRLTLADRGRLEAVFDHVQPDFIYHLAGQSSVAQSFVDPADTLNSVVIGTTHVLDVMRLVVPKARLFHAGSSECFGETLQPATETTPFYPKSPYGIAKAAAVSMVRVYRESFGLFACSGLMFNHESPLRGAGFVTKKIISAVVRIAAGSEEKLHLGRLDIRRDWCWAQDSVAAMPLMLAHPKPEDFVIASGLSHSLQEFVDTAFSYVGLNWRDHVVSDASLSRPNELLSTVGNADKAKRLLGWEAKVGFDALIQKLIEAEYSYVDATRA